jgi:hypothetical protein
LSAVIEIKSWAPGTVNDALRVRWNENGVENTYRFGARTAGAMKLNFDVWPMGIRWDGGDNK